MKKTTALRRFGKLAGLTEKYGRISATAEYMGVTRQAVFAWPEVLSKKAEKKVREKLKELETMDLLAVMQSRIKYKVIV